MVADAAKGGVVEDMIQHVGHAPPGDVFGLGGGEPLGGELGGEADVVADVKIAA